MKSLSWRPYAAALAFALLCSCLGAGDAVAAERSLLVNAAGKQALEISQHGETLTIVAAAAPALIGEAHGDAKRKYRQKDGAAVVAEVKLKPESPGEGAAGFKVRTPDGKLLWKVKVGGDKIEISADEEGTRPWTLSLKHADKIKVSDATERALGAVDYRGGKPITVQDAGGRTLFDAPAGLRSAAFGVLLIDAIPARERWIVMAEILAAGF